ncbi:MAG TPA: glycosyltransferase [Thermoanaerobaculia bacterium]|nr:glycosyltransferase [Thermoanaerobaculia bacterium]
MRVLMVIHTRWNRELGGPRAQIELGEELRRLGDTVEKLSYEDVFPEERPSRLPAPLSTLAGYVRSNRSFAARARAWVRTHGGRFDVIDANQTDLPFPKRDLGFSGLLVARSVGLIPAYEEFERMAARRWPEPFSARRAVHRALTWPGHHRRLRDVERSFRHADLINVSNSDELENVAGAMGWGPKAVMFPFGLSDADHRAFREERLPAAERLAACTAAFIGTWNARKGARDWPLIVERVRQRVPGARFLFLGTGIGREQVLRDFPAETRGALEVVPSYDNARLPGLLARVTAGAFPGYLEGFGFTVLEKLAAGLPVVAYDAPGPREMLRHQAIRTTVPVGDTEAFAARLAEVLTLTPERYGEISADSSRVAALFSWPEIARRTRETYLDRLERLRS